MYENMTMLSNKEYAELVIKANKYEQLRRRALKSGYTTSSDDTLFEFTEEELENIEKKRKGDVF